MFCYRRPPRTQHAEPRSLLLELPEECLVAVMRCCAADDLCSFFSAARSHSRLHQAAMAALHTVSAVVSQQQQADSMLLFLGKQGQQVDRLDLEQTGASIITVRQLPPNLRLGSLCLDRLHLQLQPADGFRGVLGAAEGIAALKQLQLRRCKLRDGNDGLAAALAQLPAGLEALCFAFVRGIGYWALLPTAALQRLLQLTSLQLARVLLQGADEASPVLQPLQALTRLVDLQLDMVDTTDGAPVRLTASMLSNTCSLTCLELVRARASQDNEVGDQVNYPGVGLCSSILS